MKAIKVSEGFVVKRRARLVHWCKDCRGAIEPGEEYYEFKVENRRYGYVTKRICEDCWLGRAWRRKERIRLYCSYSYGHDGPWLLYEEQRKRIKDLSKGAWLAIWIASGDER